MARSSVVKAEGRGLPSRQASVSPSPLSEAQALDAVERLAHLLSQQGGSSASFLAGSLCELAELVRAAPPGHVLVRLRRGDDLAFEHKPVQFEGNVIPFLVPQVSPRPRLGKPRSPRALLPGGNR